MPSFWEIILACLVFWMMWEVVRIGDENERLNREWENRNGKQ